MLNIILVSRWKKRKNERKWTEGQFCSWYCSDSCSIIDSVLLSFTINLLLFSISQIFEILIGSLINDNFDKTIHNQARAAAEYVRPACLPTTHVEHGARCWIAGWGYTKYDPDGSPKGSALSRFLKEAAVNVFSNDYCKENSYLKLAKCVLFKNKNVI